MEVQDFRSGYVALIGPPNAGKSTLLNYLAGEKLSIISPRPQTTRFMVRAIITFPEAQIVFVDTPGFLDTDKLKTPVERAFVVKALKVLEEVDIITAIVEARMPGEEELFLLEKLQEMDKRIILALNKIDRVKEEYLNSLLEEYRKWGEFHRIIPISAKKGTNISILVGEIIMALPLRPPLYPEEMKTDIPSHLRVGELIREKIFHLTYQEVPYATLVKVEEILDRGKVLYIKGIILVEEPSQKGILVGKGGRMIREIGKRAREELERIFQKKIYLDLEVKVEKGWRRRMSSLKELGISEGGETSV